MRWAKQALFAMNSVIKKTGIYILAFLSGLAIGFWVEMKSGLRYLIQNLYETLTHHHIQFHGKEFPLFFTPYYYPACGLVGMLVYFGMRNLLWREKVKYAFIAIIIFFVSLTSICYLDANLKIIECTACDDGIRSLSYNEINYSLIILSCAILSATPIAIKQIRNFQRRHKN